MTRLKLIGGFLFVLLFAGTVNRAFSQEIDYTQYYTNLAGYNPGFTGMEDYVDLKLGYRQGSNGFGVTNNDVFVSAYGTLGASSQYSIKKNGLRISNMDALQQVQAKQKVRRRQGIGGMVTSRTVGPYTSVSINGNYAYHLPLSSKVSLSLGTRVAYGSRRIDYNSLTVRDPINDSFYQQLLQSNPGNQNLVSIDFGTVLYSNSFYLAFSSTNLGLKNLSGDNSLSVSNNRQFSVQTAVNLPLGTSLTFSPGARLTEIEGYDLIWTVNGRLRFKELLYVGAGYTGDSKVSMLFGLSVNGKLSLNYSYDHYFSGLSNLNVNVHEIVVGIPLFNTYESKTRLW